MPWPITFHETRPEKPQVGDMWFEPWYLEDGNRDYYLSDRYKREWMGKRPPLIVRLPSGRNFSIDGKAKSGSDGWIVTGDPPKITVNPSINHVGDYHGWLQNGVLSDDVDGRKY
jgi:hypothetical protein